eukprot:gene15899-17499_t
MDVKQLSGRLAWDFSMKMAPIAKKQDDPDCVLELACFVKPPRMSFENVKIGCTKTRPLRIFNPGSVTERIELEKFPLADTGFKIDGFEDGEKLNLSLEPEEEVVLPISWSPNVAGNSRHLIVFKWIGGQKLQVIILASSIDPNAGKKKKTRRNIPGKTLQPSNRMNIIQRKSVIEKQMKKNPSQPKTPEMSQTKKMVEILPDTPTRRQTFTVKQLASDKYNDEKENYIVDGAGVENSENMGDANGKESRKGTRVQEKESGGNKEVKVDEDLLKDDGRQEEFIKGADTFSETFGYNTFHESEIRLSSSPIKFLGRDEYLAMMRRKSDLNPGQVVLNGEVKHQFLPYQQSFNSTDTLWNIEMSRETKATKHNYDDSLSFGSAESSLFTITREEKFAPHLETVNEKSINNTPRNCTTKTLTNENCNAEESVVAGFMDPCFESGDDGITLRESDDVVSCVVTEDSVGLSENNLKGVEEKDARSSDVESIGLGEVNKTAGIVEEAQASAELVREDASSAKNSLGKELIAQVSDDELVSSSESLTELGGSAESAQRASKGSNELREEPRVSEGQKNVVSVCTNEAKPVDKVKETKRQSLQPRNADRKSSGKIVESRYLKHQNKSVQSNRRRDSLKKDGNIIDAKFQSVALPKKRKSDAGVKNIVKPSLAIKKLKLVKPVTKMPRHPMPYAARNMFYDERWIEKQEKGFKNWLNYVLTPPEDDQESEVETSKGNMALESDENQPKAPTKETLSFRLYAARRRMAKLRRDACALYQSEKLSSVICKIEREIEHERLAIRTDRHVDADLGVRRHITDMLLSFNSLWLRIGIEVVFGEIIPMQSNNDVASLAKFIQRRLLANPDIAAEYSHPSVPGLFKPGYVKTLGKFTLKKLLLAIVFMDCAKTSRLISHDPCLFRKDAEFKTTRDMLLCFSRNYLHREGDIVKHLTYLGYTVSHSQVHLHEFDFGVTNLAVDLRDGLRLVRVVELLTKNWNLSSQLRVPAVSRLQKVHNVGVALQGLKEHGFQQNDQVIDAKYIVDGHREKTLFLLWQIIFHFQVDVLLDEDKLQDEIKHLEKRKVLRMKSRQLEWNNDEAMDRKRRSMDAGVYFKSSKLGLLLKWCKLVCALHDVKIENFTVSFSDGRALCCLIHHYHPTLLPAELINSETSVTCGTSLDADQDIDDGLIYENWTQCYSPTTGINRKLERLLQNEKQNFATFSDKVKEIGGAPAMIFASDMSNTIPDEKVVIAFLSFLCSRLLDIREENRAARCIQTAWRGFHLKKRQTEHKVLSTAVTRLQAFIRGYLVRQRVDGMKSACIKIQAAWRGFLTRREAQREANDTERLQQEVAAIKIQAIVRGFVQRKTLKRQQRAALVIQRAVSRYIVKKRMAARDASATLIQQRYRSWKQATHARELFLARRDAALTIQRAFRRHRELIVEREAKNATLIQSSWRMFQQRRRFLLHRQACVTIQSSFRSYVARKSFLTMRQAIVTLQIRLRAYLDGRPARCGFIKKRSSVIKIQRAYRKFAERKREMELRAAVCIQSNFRMLIERNRYDRLRRAVVLIQGRLRGRSARKKYLLLLKSVVGMQTRFRATKQAREARCYYEKLRNACMLLQARFRGMKCRKNYVSLKANALRMQAAYRGKKCRDDFVQLRASTVVVQRKFRAVLLGRAARKEYQEKKAACTSIQAWYRRVKQRQSYIQLRVNVCKIQAIYKGRKVRDSFLELRRAVVCMQRRFRAATIGNAMRRRYVQQKSASVVIQAWYRGRKQCQKFNAWKKAAIVVQSYHKMNIAKVKFGEMRRAALVIQRRYRALKIGQATQVHYLICKAAVITLQSRYRGYVARMQLRKQRKAAITIQSVVRMKLARQRYLVLKSSAVCIQVNYRAAVLGRSAVIQYQRLRCSAMVLQASYRGYRVRKEMKLKARAATKIQASFKAYTNRCSYIRMRDSAVRIQACYRRHHAERSFKVMRSSAVKIQRFYRGYKLTKQVCGDYQTTKASVVKIQASFRGYAQRRQYVALKKSVMKLQRAWRVCLERRNRDSAANVLQCRWRAYVLGRRQRNDYVKQRDACVIIQSEYRMHVAVNAFNRIKKAALVIQRCYRAQRAMQEQRQCYEALLRSAITIQATFKMHCAKREFVMKRYAALRIQRRYRVYLEAKRHERESHAAVMIQRYWRGYVMMRKCRTDYCVIRQAALLLQSAFRGLAARKEFIRSKKAAVVLQSWSRMVIAKKGYNRKRSAAIMIQRHFRAYVLGIVAVANYHVVRGALITLQAGVRGFCARRQYERQCRLIVKLQASIRMVPCRRRYEVMRRAAILVQRRVRSNAIAVNARDEFLKKKQACLKIQRMYRRYVDLRNAAVALQSIWRMRVARKEFHAKRNACIKIQANVRRFIAEQRYLMYQGAALVIQQRFRAYRVGVRERVKYERKKRACIRIQACFRMFSCRQRLVKLRSSTIVMQRRYRAQIEMKQQRDYYMRLKCAALTIQSVFRAYRARQYAARLRKQMVIDRFILFVKQQQFRIAQNISAVVIQKNYKGVKERLNYQALKRAAVQMQRLYRVHKQAAVVRDEFLRKKRSACVIQRVYRVYKAKTLMQRLKQERNARDEAAIVIQKNFKRVCMQREFTLKKQAALKIQGAFRGYLLTCLVRKRFIQTKQAVVAIQCAYRVHRACQCLKMLREKKLKQDDASVKIQKVFKGYLVRRRFLRVKIAVLTLQMYYRNAQLARKTRNDFLMKKSCALSIQRVYRGYAARKLVEKIRLRKKKEEASALKIQNGFRAYVAMKKQREEFVMKRSAVVCIQRAYRASLERRLQADIRAAIVIQRAYREYKERLMAKYNAAAIKIQSSFKAHVQLRRYRELRCAACIIQSRIRAVLRRKTDARKERSALIIQQWYRSVYLMRMQREGYMKMKQACLLIQSVWRGCKVRSKIADRKIIKARERIASANSEATESKKLCNRTASALSYLLNCKYLTTVYGALKNLEVSTRLSYRCCQTLVDDNGLGIIFKIVNKCNRGLASIGITEAAISIILNVAKCPSTYMNVCVEEGSIETFVDLLMRFKEKKTPIFVHAATLLNLICKDTAVATEIKRNEELIKKIKKLHLLMSHKADVEMKRYRPKVKTQKTKENEHIFDQSVTISKVMETLGLLR